MMQVGGVLARRLLDKRFDVETEAETVSVPDAQSRSEQAGFLPILEN